MNVRIVEEIDESQLEDVWGLYHRAFEGLNSHAVQRHLMYRHEFDQVMADPRVQKYLCRDDKGTLCGLSTYTNDLTAAPLISPQYFERRWPEAYVERRIWYVLFVAVREGSSLASFPALIDAMHRTSGMHAITVLDVCSRTDAVRHLPRSVCVLLQRLSGRVSMQRLDEQSYWSYDFSVV